MATPQDYATLMKGTSTPVFVFPILVQVAAATEAEAIDYLDKAGLQDGPVVIEQDGRRVPVLYVNVSDVPYGDITVGYHLPGAMTASPVSLEGSD